MSSKAYVTIKQAAEILGVTPLTLRNWDRSGKFPARRHPMNNYRVYEVGDLRKVFESFEMRSVVKNSPTEVKKLIVQHLGEA